VRDDKAAPVEAVDTGAALVVTLAPGPPIPISDDIDTNPGETAIMSTPTENTANTTPDQMTTPQQQTTPTAKDSLREHRAQQLAALLADGPALLELDDAIELFWAYQDRIGTCHPIGDDDQDKKLLRLAKDAGLLAGICRAIVAGEEFYRSAENRAARAAAKEQADQNQPSMHA